MNLQFFVVIILLKNAFSYKPNRRIDSISHSKPNKKIEVTPARYQIANKKTNHDAIAFQEALVEFPAVEFPTNVMESSKPFYVSTSPFPKDVKTSFDFITSTSNINIENTDYSAIKDEIAKAKENFTYLLKKDAEAQLLVDNRTLTNETPIETLSEIKTPDFGNLLTNWTSAEESCEDYVLGIIKDLDEVMTNVNKIDLNFTNGDQNSTECLNTMQIMAGGISNNNVSLTELNGNSFPLTSKEQKQSYSLFDELDTREDRLNISSYLISNESESISQIIDMQESSCEIGKTAIETSSCDEV